MTDRPELRLDQAEPARGDGRDDNGGEGRAAALATGPRPGKPPATAVTGSQCGEMTFGSEDDVGQAADLVEVVGSRAQDQFVGAQRLELPDAVAQ